MLANTIRLYAASTRGLAVSLTRSQRSNVAKLRTSHLGLDIPIPGNASICGVLTMLPSYSHMPFGQQLSRPAVAVPWA
jgi:hypothetical protein